MADKEKVKDSWQISRRQFIKGAGIVVGGTAVGSSFIISACTPEEVTKTVTKTVEVPVDVDPPEPIEGLVNVIVNGSQHVIGGLKPYQSLCYMLRERLGLFSVKKGCNMGECGTCTVLVNGKPIYSCLALAVECNEAEIETVEGLSDGITLSPVQQKIYDKDAVQCGYCTPGFIMAAEALLRQNASPSLEEVQEALSGHMCTCGNTNVVMDALLDSR